MSIQVSIKDTPRFLNWLANHIRATPPVNEQLALACELHADLVERLRLCLEDDELRATAKDADRKIAMAQIELVDARRSVDEALEGVDVLAGRLSTYEKACKDVEVARIARAEEQS